MVNFAFARLTRLTARINNRIEKDVKTAAKDVIKIF